VQNRKRKEKKKQEDQAKNAPVRVEDDGGVGGGERDALAPGLGRQQEGEAVVLGAHEAVDRSLSEKLKNWCNKTLETIRGDRERDRVG
jgi:hypothetical protein